jgi:hypothetical protein
MTDILDPLIRDLVEWVAKEPRLYGDVLEAWRTSCPRLTVWEDAPDRGFVERRLVEGRGVVVIVTDAGREFLHRTNDRTERNVVGAPGKTSTHKDIVDGQRITQDALR